METEERCLFCKSKNLKIKKVEFAPFLAERMFLAKPKQTSLVHCKNCNIYYSSYRPNSEEMARQYKDYRGEEYFLQRNKAEPNYTRDFNTLLGHNPEEVIRRKAMLAAFIGKYFNPAEIKTVLDYGGDSGQFIPACFNNAKKYVYEISNVPPVEGVQNISDETILEPSGYDFVMCCHVLEHVDYPADLTEKLISYCKDGGYIYIEVPNDNIKFYEKYIHEHITRFSPRTFAELVKMYKNVNIIAIEGAPQISVLIKKEKTSLSEQKFKYLFFCVKTYIYENYKQVVSFYRKTIMFLKLC